MKKESKKLELFTFEWYKQRDKKEFNEFKAAELAGAEISPYLEKELKEAWLKEQLETVTRHLSDNHPNGKPKTSNMFKKPFYKAHLEQFKDYLVKEYSGKPQQTTKHTEPQKKNPNTKYFVLTYLLDCKASNTPLCPINKKKNDYLLKVAREWDKFKGSPETFRRLFYSLENEKLTLDNLTKLLNDDWQSIVLELSTDKETLKDYLKHHF